MNVPTKGTGAAPAATQAPAATVAARRRRVEDLPGPGGLPLLGQILRWNPRKVHLVCERWCREYGSLFTFRLVNRPVVGVGDPELVSRILRERPERYRRFRVIERMLADIGVTGVFSAEGESWRRQRRLVAPALGARHLRAFFPGVAEVTERLLRRWRAAAATGAPLDVQRDLMRFTVDVTTGLAFGHDMNTLERGGDEVHEHLERLFPMISRRLNAPLPYWRWVRFPADRAFDRSLAAIRDLLAGVIAESRSRLDQAGDGASRAGNFLEALLLAQREEQAPLSDAEVMGNIVTVLLAGEDTTANTLAWMMYFVARHPHVQARLQEEADAVLGAGATLARYPDAERLAWVDAVANETLRLKPVAPLLFMEPQEDVELGGVHVPAGTLLVLLTRPSGLAATGTLEDHAFAPERWLEGPESGDLRAAGFVPFGAGPRLCPGRSLALLEIKCAMSMVSRNFHISEPPDAAPVGEVFAFTMMPEGLRLRLAPR